MDEDLKQYKAILLSGCANLGAAHLGFLQVLQYRKKLRFLKVIAGTSIGSIVAFLYLAGVTIETIVDEYSNKNLLNMLIPATAKEVIVRNGLANNELIIAHLIDILRKHNIDPLITFQDLFQKNNKILIVTASIYQKNILPAFKPTYFSKDTSPNLSIIKAIRSSISIPLIFVNAKIKNDLYVDGALTDDLPFAYIKDTYKIDIEDMLASAPVAVINPINSYLPNYIFALFSYLQDELHRWKYIHSRCVKTDCSNTVDADAEENKSVFNMYCAGIIYTNQFLAGRPKHDAKAEKTSIMIGYNEL